MYYKYGLHRKCYLVFLQFNIHRHSISPVDLRVQAYFWFINSKFAKFRYIPHYTVNSIFMTGFRGSIPFSVSL